MTPTVADRDAVRRPARPELRYRRLPGIDPRAARLTAESALLGLVAGAIVVAPWTRDGYLLLLDWVSGPHQAISPGLYGLDPAALDALPYRLATHGLRALLGSAATAWLVVLAYFPIVASGVSAAVGGGRLRRHSAALFACGNPFVVERVQAGHVAFLLSVGLLAWLLASALRARRRGGWFAVRPACWFALATAVGPHAAWLGGAVLLAVALLPRPRRHDLIRTALVVASAAFIYAYAVAVLAGAILTPRIGVADLDVYAPQAGPHGLPFTLLSLQGFWRAGADSTPPVTLGVLPSAAMIVVALLGLVRLCRSDVVLGAPLVVLATAGLLLGAGVRGPLAAGYRAAFGDLPLFAVMREQQKWVALTMLAYAAAAGAFAELLADVGRSARPVVVRLVAGGALLAVAGMPALVAPALGWGLGGTITTSQYPAVWYAADHLMGDGAGSVLFLPWHEYQPFGFTGARTVATPAGAFFRRPVLSSDAVELGPVRTNSVSRRTAYVQRLVAAGGAGGFGRQVAPLGVHYVVLSREREADSYGWLDRQPDLRRVMRTPQLNVYQVLASAPGAARVHRLSSTAWRVDPGPPGPVVIPEEWSPGWSAGDRPTRATVAGTVEVRAGPESFTVTYRPWRWLRLGLAVSLLSLVLLVALGLAEHRRDLRDWWHAGPG